MRTLILASFLGLLLPACAGAPDSPDSIDSLDDDVTSVDGKADSFASTSTYYTVRPDLRRCAYPRCGGSWVQRVNSTTAEQYVSEID